MPHISKRRLKRKIATGLADQFLLLLASAKIKSDARSMASELLSQTERVMLAKRLAIIVLLVCGYRFKQIEEALKITPQTITRIWQALEGGVYDHIAHYAFEHLTKGKKEPFLEKFIRMLHLGMPPRSGRNRRVFWQKQAEHRQRTRSPHYDIS